MDRLVREGQATIDEIVQRIETLGAQASWSSVQRYVRRAKAEMAHYREVQQVAKTWIGKLQENPDSDVGRLLSEMLRTVAFRTIAGMSGEDEEGSGEAKELSLLARAIKDLASADKLAAERSVSIRATLSRLEREAEREIGQAGSGLDLATLQRVKQELYGIQ